VPEPPLTSVSTLVTGGAGFIGSHLVDALLSRGARVRVLDNLSTGKRDNLQAALPSVELIEGDIRDLEACRRACEGVAIVFHQAALGSVPRSMNDPATSFAINVSGTANVLAAARDAGVKRVVYASSSSVFGDSEKLPKREGEEGRPLSPYALSKWMDEELGELFTRAFGLETIGLRYFNVYGPRQDPSGPYAAVIPRFFDACSRGEAPVIFGDGEQSRDFTFVADAVLANLLAAGAPASRTGRAYNVGAGQAATVKDLAIAIGKIMGVTEAPKYAPVREGDVMHSLASTADVEEALGFRAQVTLEEGLRRTRPAVPPKND
jgi:nucleoside-diphosphate-sugar epimerase